MLNPAQIVALRDLAYALQRLAQAGITLEHVGVHSLDVVIRDLFGNLPAEGYSLYALDSHSIESAVNDLVMSGGLP